MCAVMKKHGVLLSTSIDGPAALHNRNRPTPTRDAFERTVTGIEMARELIGKDCVSALMTTTRDSLLQPEAIVDEYVRLGFHDIFVRPLSAYGFAKRNQSFLAYSLEAFKTFYDRAVRRVLHWNRQGFALREVYASVVLNKALSPFDSGYVDLQSPTGAGSSVMVFNYDGFVYPSDEARMLAENGDTSLRLGRIGEQFDVLRSSEVNAALRKASLAGSDESCRSCAYNQYCAPNPVEAQAQHGRMDAPAVSTEHCQRHLWMFDHFLDLVAQDDPWLMDLFYSWAMPRPPERAPCAA
jgi:His-Xaa-Ser system radical SAM maturase HxsB